MIQLDAMSSFVAIDFETANHQWNSACAVGFATGSNGRIEFVRSFLIRPPAPRFVFTDVHGLRWEDVRDAPTFGELWPAMLASIDHAEFIAAHNAPFDRNVLQACCAMYGIRIRTCARRGQPFICTVQLARAQWGITTRSRRSTRHGCPMFAGASAFLCVTTMRGRTRKRVRVSCSRRSEKNGVLGACAVGSE